MGGYWKIFLAELPQSDVDQGDASWWILNVDNASRQIGVGVGLQLKAPTGERIEQVIWFGFLMFNNETKYEAILARVDLAKSISSEKIMIHSDSQLLVREVKGEYKPRHHCMVMYTNLVKQRLGIFAAWKLEHIPRNSNEKANTLAVVAASIPIKETVFLLVYCQPASSITTNQVSYINEGYSSWLTPITRYLSLRELLNNRIEAHKIQVQAARFSIVNGQLYKRSLDGPYLKCLTTQQGQYVLAELHEGICGNHPTSRNLAHRAHT